jgi:phosphatidylinositol alpha 1,6-mannosyltransferase
MRVAIATESYWPEVNGVANSVMRVGENLVRMGHEPLVIAPRPEAKVLPSQPDPGLPVIRLPGVGLPGYQDVRLARPNRRIEAALRDFKPDILHLASPFVLGAWASSAAAKLNIPMVAIYQTDVPGFARPYGFLGVGERLAWRWIRRIHRRATLTLAPSSATAAELTAHDIPRVGRWGRGVDIELYHPRRRSEDLRRQLAPNGEVLVGYVGRLAAEKCVELLAPVTQLAGVKVIIVGDGPTRRDLERAMPSAVFLGTKVGVELAQAYASLDVFVHTGPHDTFCQAIQEALASGLPVIGPAIGGPIDLITPGVTGTLVPPENADAIVEAARPLIADLELRQAYGKAAREFVAGRDWASTVEQLVRYYEAAIADAAVPTQAAKSAA